MNFLQDIEDKTIKLENAECLKDVEILTDLAAKIYAVAIGNAENLGGLKTEELTRQLDFAAKASFFFADRFISVKNQHLTYMRQPVQKGR